MATDKIRGPSHRRPVDAPLFQWLVARLPDALANAQASVASSASAVFVARVVAVLLAFVLLDGLLERAAGLSGESYEQPFLALELVRHFGWLMVTVLVLGVAALLRFGALKSGWQDLQQGKSLRLFVLFLCAMVAWPFVTHGYNYYFDQGHGVDRLLIALLLPLIWWRPVFVLPFLALLYAMMGQLTEPALGGTILAHKLQVARAIGLFGAAFLVHAVSGERRTDHYVFLTCCLVAAAYWLPALTKLKLGWLGNDHLYVVPLASYAHGWLGHLTAEEVVTFARSLIWLDPLMRITVVVVESACLVFLWSRRVSVGLLIGVIVFHFGVFALFGFLFWTWIALDAALLVLLWQGVFREDPRVRRSVSFGLSVMLILTASWWARPPPLGWYDTPLSYSYRITANLDDGTVRRLHPRFFAPYEDVFTMSSFGYLVSGHAILVGPYGVTHDRAINEGLDTARSPAEVFAMEAARETRYDGPRAQRFYRFLEHFVTQRNQQGDRGQLLYALHPPLQFWSQIDGLRNLGGRKITELVVTEVTTFFDGHRLQVIRKIEIGRIPILGQDGSQ